MKPKPPTLVGGCYHLYDKEAWDATHELTSNAEIVKSLERAEADVKAGKLKSWADVKREV